MTKLSCGKKEIALQYSKHKERIGGGEIQYSSFFKIEEIPVAETENRRDFNPCFNIYFLEMSNISQSPITYLAPTVCPGLYRHCSRGM